MQVMPVIAYVDYRKCCVCTSQ